MENVREAAQPLLEQLKAYAETRIKLIKYQAIEKGTTIAADIITDLIIVFSLLLAFLFGSVTLGFYLAFLLHSNWAGFGCVAGFYLLIAILMMVFKGGFERPIINLFIKKFFKQ